MMLRTRYPYVYLKIALLKELSFEQEWIAKAKLIRCPAPLLGTPLGGDSAGAFSGAEPSDEDFFPRFEVITSGSLEAVLFFPWESISEEHRMLMDTVIGRISSTESGLYMFQLFSSGKKHECDSLWNLSLHLRLGGERVPFREEHRTLMDTVIERISSAESGLYEAARSFISPDSHRTPRHLHKKGDILYLGL